VGKMVLRECQLSYIRCNICHLGCTMHGVAPIKRGSDEMNLTAGQSIGAGSRMVTVIKTDTFKFL